MGKITITDEELNYDVKLMPYDRLVKALLLWMFPMPVRPNHITVARMLLSPLVFVLLWKEEYALGLVTFLLVALTDAIDGAMARTRRQITVWGTLYDGVADKVLIGGVVLILVLKHLGVWLSSAIVGLEVFTLLGAGWFKKKGIVHPANVWGKIKMNLQVIGVAVLLIDLIWSLPVAAQVSGWVFVGSVAFGFMSIIGHAVKL